MGTTWEAEIVWCDENGDVQAEGRTDEVLQPDNLRRTNDGYGLTRRPPEGTIIHVTETEGGDLVIIGEEPASRPELGTDGQVRLWSDGGHYVDLVPGGEVTVHSNAKAVIEGVSTRLGAADAAKPLVRNDIVGDLVDFFNAWKAALGTLKAGCTGPIAATAALIVYTTTMDGLIVNIVADSATWESHKHYMDE